MKNGFDPPSRPPPPEISCLCVSSFGCLQLLPTCEQPVKAGTVIGPWLLHCPQHSSFFSCKKQEQQEARSSLTQERKCAVKTSHFHRIAALAIVSVPMIHEYGWFQVLQASPPDSLNYATNLAEPALAIIHAVLTCSLIQAAARNTSRCPLITCCNSSVVCPVSFV